MKKMRMCFPTLHISSCLLRRGDHWSPVICVSHQPFRASNARPYVQFSSATGFLLGSHSKRKEKSSCLLNSIEFLDSCDSIFLRRNSIRKSHRECVFTLVKTHSPLCVPCGFRRIASRQWSYAFFVRSFGYALF